MKKTHILLPLCLLFCLTAFAQTVSLSTSTQALPGFKTQFTPAIYKYQSGLTASANYPKQHEWESQLMAFQHEGFWQPMDTLREKELLESHWATGAAPWRIWE